LTVSSDKISTLREPALFLNLLVNKSTEKKEILLELPKEDLASFIKTLERISEVPEPFSIFVSYFQNIQDLKT
jgi:hypothetical protein